MKGDEQMRYLSRMSEAWTTNVPSDANAFGMNGGPCSETTSNANVRKTNAGKEEGALVL